MEDRQEKERLEREMPVLSCLRDRLKDWYLTRRGFVLIPKNEDLGRVLYHRTKAGQIAFDRYENLSTEVEVVPPEKMNTKWKESYKILKNCECELRWHIGLLKRKPQFDPSDMLLRLRSYIPEISPTDRMSRILLSKEEILKKMNETKPDELNIMLASTPDSSEDFPFSTPDSFLTVMTEFYQNPTRIAWQINISKIIYRGKGICKIVNSLLDLLKLTGQTLVAETKQQ